LWILVRHRNAFDSLLFFRGDFLKEQLMAFSTTSYLAGIGSVVVVLSTGFAGGYFLANPAHNDPPNRLQRVAASALPPTSAAQPTNPPKQEVAEAEAAPLAPPVAAPSQSTSPQPVAQQAPVSAAPVVAMESEPDRGAVEQEKPRADVNRSAEKKKIEARKIAERQRKQREIEYAATAVRRMLRDRDAQQMVENDGPETASPNAPRISFFGR
jgi:hypothetical protein